MHALPANLKHYNIVGQMLLANVVVIAFCNMHMQVHACMPMQTMNEHYTVAKFAWRST